MGRALSEAKAASTFALWACAIIGDVTLLSLYVMSEEGGLGANQQAVLEKIQITNTHASPT